MPIVRRGAPLVLVRRRGMGQNTLATGANAAAICASRNSILSAAGNCVTSDVASAADIANQQNLLATSSGFSAFRRKRCGVCASGVRIELDAVIQSFRLDQPIVRAEQSGARHRGSGQRSECASLSELADILIELAGARLQGFSPALPDLRHVLAVLEHDEPGRASVHHFNGASRYSASSRHDSNRSSGTRWGRLSTFRPAGHAAISQANSDGCGSIQRSVSHSYSGREWPGAIECTRACFGCPFDWRIPSDP